MAKYMPPGFRLDESNYEEIKITGMDTSTAGFVGMAQLGPVSGRPVLLASFEDYQRNFGGYLPEDKYGEYRFLPYSVEQFFQNGGSRCYVMRVVPGDALTAKSPADMAVRAKAKAPGEWGNRMELVFYPLQPCGNADTGGQERAGSDAVRTEK